MADILTEITEIVTGLGATGIDDLANALAARPMTFRNVTDDHWSRLQAAYDQGQHPAAFAAAWANGRAFYESRDGLRGRPPITIEWKGPPVPMRAELAQPDRPPLQHWWRS
jgi:hypothetical protein